MLTAWECTTETFLTKSTDLGWSDVRLSIFRRGEEYQVIATARAEWRPAGEDVTVTRRCYRENVCDAVRCVANDLSEVDRDAAGLAAKAAQAIIAGLDPVGW
jgi:hypothetical protein